VSRRDTGTDDGEPAATLPGLPGGEFSAWLQSTRIAQVEDTGADVPCGACNACCTSSYFIHVGPTETGTLARIPEELLFAAPGLPKGHVLLGYDEHGHCPMYRDHECSIYEDRPLTCRIYDCRVFTAAGIAADRPRITDRARRWAFSQPTEDDRERHSAVKAAAKFLQAHAECFPEGAMPDNPAHVAVLAIKVHDVFLNRGDEAGGSGRAPSDAERTTQVIEASAKFEARRDALKTDG
jgi:uncharacterized protein